uniref:Uncharacterized protein n=1 Tax=Arundo donax TaxID=35708 RepID=A0A0A9DPB8_ARUDO
MEALAVYAFQLGVPYYCCHTFEVFRWSCGQIYDLQGIIIHVSSFLVLMCQQNGFV